MDSVSLDIVAGAICRQEATAIYGEKTEKQKARVQAYIDTHRNDVVALLQQGYPKYDVAYWTTVAAFTPNEEQRKAMEKTSQPYELRDKT